MSGSGQPAAYGPAKLPEIRSVAPGDIFAALKAGIADFLRAPLFGLFFGGIYAIGGLFIMAALTVFDMPWMILPVAIGFPLVGPFIAVGLYEVSRRLAAGKPLEWGEVLLVIFRQRERQIGWMAFVVLFIFWIWIYQVRLLLALFLGFKSFSTIDAFVEIITTTQEGLGFLGVGTMVGAFLAFILFSSTVIAMPLLLDSELDFVSAMIVSFKTVFKSPVAMLGWGVVVTVLAVAAMVPAFLGLIVVLPVLGHATWHLYQRAIVKSDS
jgi:uncharacterized membrane protein